MSFIKDSIFLVLGFMIKLVFALLTDRYIATNVLPDLYGAYKYSITIVTLFSGFAGLGFQSSIVRTITVNLENSKYINKVIRTSLILILGLSVLSYFFINTTIFYSFFEVPIPVIQIISIGIGFIAINQFIVGVYSGLKNVKNKVLINDVFQPLFFFGLLIYFINEINVLLVSMLYVVSIVFTLMLNLIFIGIELNKKFAFFSFKKNEGRISIRDYYKYSFPILLTIIFIGLSTSTDKIVMAKIIEAKEIGLYFSAFTLSNILGFILTSLLFLFLPVASGFYGKGKFIGGSYVSAYISKWLMLVSFIPFWLLFNYSEEILTWFYSGDYSAAATTLEVLSIAGFVNVSVGFTGQSLLALGDSFSQMIIRMIGVCLTITLSYILGLSYGIYGIAVSVLLSLIITNSLQVGVAYFKYKVALIQKVNIYTYIFIISIIIVLHIRNRIFSFDNFIIDFIIDITMYLVLIMVFKVINTKDYRTVKLIQ